MDMYPEIFEHSKFFKRITFVETCEKLMKMVAWKFGYGQSRKTLVFCHRIKFGKQNTRYFLYFEINFTM